MAKLERLYTIPLGDAYKVSRDKRTPRAVKLIRAFIIRHMKAKDERVVISEELNKLLWVRSIQKPPRRVKVRLIKEDGETVRAYLPDEKIPEPKKSAVGSKAPGAPLSADNREEKKEEKKAAATPASAPAPAVSKPASAPPAATSKSEAPKAPAAKAPEPAKAPVQAQKSDRK